MGWIGLNQRFASKLDAVLASEHFGREQIVASNTVGKVVNIAYRANDTVFALVCLVETRTKHGQTETFVKCMDETMGPYYFTASDKVLAALLPTDNETANAWRERCRTAKARTVEVRKQAKSLQAGQVAKLNRDVTFRGGKMAAGSEVKLYEVRRNSVVIAAGGHLVQMKTTSYFSHTAPTT